MIINTHFGEIPPSYLFGEVAARATAYEQAHPDERILRLGIGDVTRPLAPAVVAAQDPAPGDWLYFVTIDLQGTTVFTRDYQQHLASIELAKRNGVLDSAR